MEILKGVESFAGNQSPKSNTPVVVAIDDDVVVEVEDVVDVVLLLIVRLQYPIEFGIGWLLLGLDVDLSTTTTSQYVSATI